MKSRYAVTHSQMPTINAHESVIRATGVRVVVQAAPAAVCINSIASAVCNSPVRLALDAQLRAGLAAALGGRPAGWVRNANSGDRWSVTMFCG